MEMARRVHNQFAVNESDPMKQPNNPRIETNTYALLIHSEDRERSLSETFIYLLLILMAALSMWLVAHQPVRLPIGAIRQTETVAQVAAPQPECG